MSKNSQATRSFPRVKIGVSSCLLGQEVRYNGGHKQDRFLVSSLSRFVDYVPVCPEVAIGLGIPRPPIRLVGDPDRPKAVGTDDSTMDVTSRLQSFAQDTVPSLGEICGYILKKDSPSCGMERVKVYSEKGGAAERKGQGVFARVLMERMPLLPVEEEGFLQLAARNAGELGGAGQSQGLRHVSGTEMLQGKRRSSDGSLSQLWSLWSGVQEQLLSWCVGSKPFLRST